MIGISFKLTPYQTRLLIEMAFEHFQPEHLMAVPSSNNSYFLMSAGALKRKGLVQHRLCGEKEPAWTATEEGKAVANLIIKHAKELVELSEVKQEVKEGGQ